MSKRGAKRTSRRKTSAPRKQAPVAARASRRPHPAEAERSDGDDGSLEMPSLMGARVRRMARAMMQVPLTLARAVVERLRRARD